ncbi:hypothetical protein M1116_02670 [Patescibacteria group bacterium]|nr:hypothetical protein [Patescibacteria group bacterium]
MTTAVPASPLSFDPLPPLAASPKHLISYEVGRAKPLSSQPRYPNFLELLNESLYHFVDNFFYIIIVAASPYLFLSAGILIPIFLLKFTVDNDLLTSPPSPVVVVSLLGLYFLFLIIGELWLQTSFLYLIAHLEEKPSFTQILAASFKKTWALCWLLCLFLLLTFGGSLLLLIPGIILSIFSIFAPYVLMVEEVGGFTALHISRLRLQPYFWSLIQRLVLFIGTIAMLYIAVGLLAATVSFKSLANVLEIILNLTIPVIYLIFLGRNYQAIRWLTIERSTTVNIVPKLIYLILIIFPLGLAVLLLFLNLPFFINTFHNLLYFPNLPLSFPKLVNSG